LIDNIRWYSSQPLTADTVQNQVVVGNENALYDISQQVSNLINYSNQTWETTSLFGSDFSPEIEYKVTDLEDKNLAICHGNEIILDTDAAGYGWFIDETPWANEEFTNIVYDWELHADANSPVAGKIDLLTVLMHEMGHVLGLPDVSAGIDPTRLMTGILPTGVRRLPSELDLAMLAPEPNTSETEPSTGLAAVDYSDFIRRLHEYDDSESSVVEAQHQETYDPDDLRIGITNGTFAISDENDAGFGWSLRSDAYVQDGVAVLDEGRALLTNMSQIFIIPDGAIRLRFTLPSVVLGTSERSPPDAFEVALLNADTMASLVGIAEGLNNTDAFLNIQHSGQAWFGPGASIAGLAASGDTLSLNEPVTVELDISGVPPGTIVRLYFDLLGFGDLDSQVIVDNVFILTEGPSPPIAISDTSETESGRAVEINVLSNDLDPNGELDPTTITIVAGSGPDHGTTEIDSTTGVVTYTADSEYVGEDSFTYTVRDTEGNESNVTTVTITILEPTVTDNYPPEVAPINDVTIDEGETMVLSGAFADSDADDSWTATVDFGDGSGVQPLVLAGTAFELMHTYADDGTYFVIVIVTDSYAESDTEQFEVMVLNVVPTVEAGDDQATDEGSTVIFSGSFTDPGVLDTRAIEWDFGDGSTALGVLDPTHTYTDDGVYTVALTVTDDGGGVGQDTLTVIVANVLPTIELDGSTSVEEGSLYMLTLGVVIDPGDDTITEYVVHWGDDTTNTYPGIGDVTHTYADGPADCIITVDLVDEDGTHTDAGSFAVSVTNVVPILTITGPGEVDEGGIYTLNLSSADPGEDTISSWQINWGDGAVETVAGNPSSVDHVYEEGPGFYTVAAEATDEDGIHASNNHSVVVHNVVPTVDAGVDQMVGEGGTVSILADFTDPGLIDTHTAMIDWGDGISEAGVVDSLACSVSGNHVYADNGVYTITVTVFDDDGDFGSDVLTVTVLNVAPTVDAGSDQTVDEGMLVALDPATFNDLGTLDTHTATIAWGDGTVPDIGLLAESPFGPPGSTSGADGTVDGTHVYADNGIYMVAVTVTDDDGTSTSDTLTVTVLNAAPTVEAGSDQTVNEGEVVNFSGSFTDPGLADTHTIEWDFGDGTTTVGTLTPSHVYADNGIYTVTLTVTDDDGGTTNDALTVTVNNVAPAVDAGSDQIVDEGDVVNFSGSFADPGSADTHTIDWDFGDSTAAVGTLAPNHVYADNGIYTVTSTVTDDDGGVGVDALTVTVNNVAATVNAGSDQTVDEGAVVSLDPAAFNDLGTLDTHTTTIDWGDGTPVVVGTVSETPSGPPGSTAGTDGTVDGSHVYADNSVYTVTVTVYDDDGALTSDTLTVTVLNVAPAVEAGSDQTVVEGEVVSFSGSFTDPGSADTHTIEWDFGDGTTTVGTLTPNHVYADNGIYTVTLTVTDDDGGVGVDALTITANNIAPTVNAGPDQTVNEGAVVSLDPATFNDLGTLDTHTATIDWGDGTAPEDGIISESPFGPPGSTSGANGTVTVDGSHVYDDNGTYTVTVTVTDDDGASTSDTFDVTVNNVNPIVTADYTNQEVQYSDPIQGVSFSATDPSIDTMNAETSYSIDDGQFIPGLPDSLTIDAGLSFDGAGGQQTEAIWNLSGIADLSPGTYIIRVMVTDDDSGMGFADTTIVVAPEYARSTYVGPMFVSTLSINETIAIVEFRAVIQDISFYPEDPNWDPNAGNITTSMVTFIDRDNDNAVIATGLPVQLIDPADSTTGVAIYQWSVDLGNQDSESFTVRIIIEGYYSSPDEETVITVSKPLRDFITGGGYLINENSAGIYAGDPGLKTNFGFNVKFNKKLTNLQGKVNAIIRKDGRLYQIKTNATQSLVVDPINNTATFLSKGNLNDITDPNNPISLGGNLSLIVIMTDLGEPGTSDSISFTLWEKNELWFSSNWIGAQTLEQVLARGNLVVHAESLALHAADGSADEQTDGRLITPELLEPVVEEAVLRWADYGIGSKYISTLQDVEFRIADLAGSTIGLALGNTIWLDIDAAGYGWFIDSTPWDDAEFSRRNTGSELVAKRTSEAYGNIDLLTVVMHEMGHTLGFEDLTSEAESKDLMYEILQSGVRRTKTLPNTRRSITHSAVAWHYLDSRQKDNLLLNSWFSDWLRRYEELASRSRAH
jgi:PKD repeat protein